MRTHRNTNKKALARITRHRRVRRYIKGSTEIPRLCVFLSSKHVYTQIIDDSKSHTVLSCSTQNKDIIKKRKSDISGVELCKIVGQAIGKMAVEKGIEKVVFDRSGYRYHGRIKALADGAREAGLKF